MWMKVDDRLHSHRKTRTVSKSHGDKRRDIAPMGLWVAAGSWSAQNGTDGWVPEDDLDRWDDDWKMLAARLVDSGYWWVEDRDGESGYGFHDWHDYNFPTEAASASGTFGNHIRWHEKRSLVDPECEHCPRDPGEDSVAPESGGDIGSPSGGDIGGRIAKPIGGDRSTQPDPIPSHPLPEATSKPARTKSAKTNGVSLPEDWKPTKEHIERALAAGLVLGREVDKFRQHAAEKGRKAVSWNAAFTRWLITAEDYATRDRPAVAAPRQLPHVSEIETPPNGLSDEEYDSWLRERQR